MNRASPHFAPTSWINPSFTHQSAKRARLAKFIQHRDGIALVPDRTSDSRIPDEACQLELAADEAITACGGDMRETIKALLTLNDSESG